VARNSRFSVYHECRFSAGLGLASQGWCRAGARTYEESTPISCGRFFLTDYPPSYIFDASQASSYHLKKEVIYEVKMGKEDDESIFCGVMLIIFWLCHTRTTDCESHAELRTHDSAGTDGEVRWSQGSSCSR
jgi:hypothetical protein